MLLLIIVGAIGLVAGVFIGGFIASWYWVEIISSIPK